jgi:hypothetical protein
MIITTAIIVKRNSIFLPQKMSTTISLPNIQSLFTGWSPSPLYDLIEATSSGNQPSEHLNINVRVYPSKVPGSSPGTYVDAPISTTVYTATVNVSGDISMLSTREDIVTADSFDIVYNVPLKMSSTTLPFPDSVCSFSSTSPPFPSPISCNYMICKFFKIIAGIPEQVGTLTSSYPLYFPLGPGMVDGTIQVPSVVLNYDFAVILTQDTNGRNSIAFGSKYALELVVGKQSVVWDNTTVGDIYNIAAPLFPATDSHYASNAYVSGSFIDPDLPAAYVFATINSCATLNDPGAVYSSIFTDMSGGNGALNYAQATLANLSQPWDREYLPTLTPSDLTLLGKQFPSSIVFLGFAYLFTYFLSLSMAYAYDPTMEFDFYVTLSLCNY